MNVGTILFWMLLGWFCKETLSFVVCCSSRPCSSNNKKAPPFGTILQATNGASLGKEDVDDDGPRGAYRSLADMVWDRLLAMDWWKDPFAENANTEDSSSYWNTYMDLMEPRQVPAPGGGPKASSSVRITHKVLIPKSKEDTELVRYARFALLETISDKNGTTCYDGIQVLNLVVFPSISGNLPVWGMDLVSLPGDKHLWLLDAQPMVHNDNDNNKNTDIYSPAWTRWHQDYVIGKNATSWILPWGGDLPPAVQKYVSPNALWTRLTSKTHDIPDLIEDHMPEAVMAHLMEYLAALFSATPNGAMDEGPHPQEAYIAYRRENDPAKPMLKSLFGSNYTDDVLKYILFPPVEPQENF